MRGLILASAFVIAVSAIGVPARSASSNTVPRAVQALGHTPQWVYRQFGKPAYSNFENLCCEFQGFQPMGILSRNTLVHAYDLIDGGRVAFVYSVPLHSSQYVVVGVVYDALDAVRYQNLASFFPHNGDPRQRRLFTCYEDDFYHSYNGKKPSLSTYAAWTAPTGRLVFARYLVTKPPTRYDPVTAKDVPTAIKDLDAHPMVQFGYFQSPQRVMDLHMAVDDDFSINTEYKDCIR